MPTSRRNRHFRSALLCSACLIVAVQWTLLPEAANSAPAQPKQTRATRAAQISKAEVCKAARTFVEDALKRDGDATDVVFRSDLADYKLESRPQGVFIVTSKYECKRAGNATLGTFTVTLAKAKGSKWSLMDIQTVE